MPATPPGIIDSLKPGDTVSTRIEDGNPLTVPSARKEPHIFKIRLKNQHFPQKIRIPRKNHFWNFLGFFGFFGIFGIFLGEKWIFDGFE